MTKGNSPAKHPWEKVRLIALIVKLLSNLHNGRALLLDETVRLSWLSVTPSIIRRGLVMNPRRYKSVEDFEVLCRKAMTAPLGSRARYKIQLYDASADKTSEANNFGCCHLLCPTRRMLFDLANEAKNPDMEPLPKIAQNLADEKWGVGMKLCGGCRRVAYCSRECQKEDWINGHRSRCQESDKKESGLTDSASESDFEVIATDEELEVATEKRSYSLNPAQRRVFASAMRVARNLDDPA